MKTNLHVIKNIKIYLSIPKLFGVTEGEVIK